MTKRGTGQRKSLLACNIPRYVAAVRCVKETRRNNATPNPSIASGTRIRVNLPSTNGTIRSRAQGVPYRAACNHAGPTLFVHKSLEAVRNTSRLELAISRSHLY